MATTAEQALTSLREEIVRLAENPKWFKGKEAMVERKTRELNALIDEHNALRDRAAKAEAEAGALRKLLERERDTMHRLVLWARLQGVDDGTHVVPHYTVEQLDQAIDVRVEEFKGAAQPWWWNPATPWLDSNWRERHEAALSALSAAVLLVRCQEFDEAYRLRMGMLKLLSAA